MSDRLGELEMLSRCRELTDEESDELGRIIRNERRRQWYRQNKASVLAGLRHRYANDDEYRQRRIASASEAQRKRRA
jgi:hypothetical protein